MGRSVVLITLVVRDYDEAIGFYRDKLGFHLLEDSPLSEEKRWVVVAPDTGGTSLLLAKAGDAMQEQRIGDQTGGRVFLFLQTDDFRRDYERYRAAGVRFLEEPRVEEYGVVAVCVDLYGNKWDLIEPRETET